MCARFPQACSVSEGTSSLREEAISDPNAAPLYIPIHLFKIILAVVKLCSATIAPPTAPARHILSLFIWKIAPVPFRYIFLMAAKWRDRF